MVVIDIQMPENCYDCELWDSDRRDDFRCVITHDIIPDEGKPKNCPIVAEVEEKDQKKWQDPMSYTVVRWWRET